MEKINLGELNKKKLINSYNDALKDPDFKKVVDKLKLSDEELMKYTSIIESSVCELKNCKNCKNIFECKNKIEGYVYLPRVIDNEINFYYKPCKYKKKIEENSKHLKNIYMVGMNEYVTDASFENVYKDDKKRYETIKWIVNFLNNYEKDKHIKGLYLSGSFGCGKTYLISALFNELAKKGYKSSIVFFPEFIRTLKANFDEDYNEIFETVKKSPILLIDDIGAEVLTPWSRDEILCSLLQYRMQEKLPTFFTTNFTKEELEKHLSDSKNGVDELKAKRIMERINQLTDNIVMISDNLRK